MYPCSQGKYMSPARPNLPRQCLPGIQSCHAARHLAEWVPPPPLCTAFQLLSPPAAHCIDRQQQWIDSARRIFWIAITSAVSSLTRAKDRHLRKCAFHSLGASFLRPSSQVMHSFTLSNTWAGVRTNGEAMLRCMQVQNRLPPWAILFSWNC